jgi:hypothetical protein
MENLNKRTLSLLSLLIIPGILLMPLFWESHLILIPISMCSIGGLSFGSLIAKSM